MRPLTLLTTLLATSLSMAQADAFDKHVASVEVLQAKPVQSELKISEGQRAALNKHAAWYNKATEGIVKSLGNSPSTAEKEKSAERIQSLHGQLKDKVFGELSKWQMKRLGQISLQQLGVLAVMDAKVASKIGLSSSQLKTIRDGWNRTGTKVAEIERKARQPIWDKYKAKKPKDDKEAQSLRTAFEQEMRAAGDKIAPQLKAQKEGFESLVDKTLSASQKKTWDELKGKPFSV